jgi:hypothetical protein
MSKKKGTPRDRGVRFDILFRNGRGLGEGPEPIANKVRTHRRFSRETRRVGALGSRG